MSKLEEDRKKISKAVEHEEGKRIDEAFKLRCTQDQFNDAIMLALSSLKNAEKTHEQRVAFLAYAERRIREETEMEGK